MGCKVGVEGDKGAYKIATYKALLSSVVNEQILWCIYLLWLIMLSLRFFSLLKAGANPHALSKVSCMICMQLVNPRRASATRVI